MHESSDITAKLAAWNRGEPGALERLVPHIYVELRRMAQGYLNKEAACWSVAPTELVHEVFLRLTGLKKHDWKNRAHFFGGCSGLMRNILVDMARKRNSAKRSATLIVVDLDGETPAGGEGIDLEAIDEALTALAKLDERQSKIVELRFFVGLSVEETAEVMGISPATVKREWASAKAWLLRRLSISR
jgi:RNA polymerase sigma-70 factor, ECF subfamily